MVKITTFANFTTSTYTFRAASPSFQSLANGPLLAPVVAERDVTYRLETEDSIMLSDLRKVLIHGARAAAMRIKRDRAPIGAWMGALEARALRNILVVAMANKLARIAWAVLSSGNDYRPVASTPA
jgi:hypothetical protein